MQTPALVIDDTASAASAAAATLSEVGYRVTRCATVVAALAHLSGDTPAVVVLDLSLDEPHGPLHDALERRGIPVVLVSGVEPESLPAIARDRRWGYLAKPYEPDALVAAVARATGRSSVVPTPITPARTEDTGSRDSTPPAVAANADAAVRNANGRRALRGLCALVTGGLVAYFESRGHTVPTIPIVALAAFALGPEAIARALNRRPAVAVGGGAALALLALTGSALDARELSQLAALGTGAIGVVDDFLDRLA